MQPDLGQPARRAGAGRGILTVPLGERRPHAPARSTATSSMLSPGRPASTRSPTAPPHRGSVSRRARSGCQAPTSTASGTRSGHRPWGAREIRDHSVIVTTMLGVSEERSFTNGKPAPPRAERDPVKVAAGIGSREVEFSPLGVTREDLENAHAVLPTGGWKDTAGLSTSRRSSRGGNDELRLKAISDTRLIPAGSGRAIARLAALAGFAPRPLVLDLADQISTHLREGMIEVALVGGRDEVRPSR